MERKLNSISDFFDRFEIDNSATKKTNPDAYCSQPPHNKNGGILTMAFVDMQPLDEVYSLSESFSAGTLFPNIDKPFYGGMRK